jgi:hypothetical protein
MDVDHVRDCGLEDRWRIVVVEYEIQINDMDELRGSEGELNDSLVPILKLV